MPSFGNVALAISLVVAAVMVSNAFVVTNPVTKAAGFVGHVGRANASSGVQAPVMAAGVATVVGLLAGARKHRTPRSTLCKYTTKTIIPSLAWLKTSIKGGELGAGDLRGIGLAGCDVCIGRTDSGKLFALGDKAPPTGSSLSVGAVVAGEKVVDAQFGNTFDVFTGQPQGDWCPSPPIIGSFVGWFMGERQALATFEVRETFFGGEVEVLIDTNAKSAYEANYWKGLLDAQGKDDGTYY
mmetsp:Transcript_68435/g.107586  ORF Transcript_68435/g.107586 Transcript_68435/m.107586 type:complete len:240 (+) Transcript_68435:62-781(+)